MRALDAFALPSRAEGISNTVLEAMATALPVVATAVGGNVDLLTDGVTGRLVPASDADTMAGALLADFQQRDQARERGRRARLEVEQRFSLDGMVGSYADLYDAQLRKAAARGALQHRFT
jgi:glycosyltransferase involved in cell wall biosynthesis